VKLTISDIAYVLDVTRATVYNRQKAGDLPPGTGLDVIKAAIDADERRIADIRERLAEIAYQKLVVTL
jgi:hypothetical protein